MICVIIIVSADTGVGCKLRRIQVDHCYPLLLISTILYIIIIAVHITVIQSL